LFLARQVSVNFLLEVALAPPSAEKGAACLDGMVGELSPAQALGLRKLTFLGIRLIKSMLQ
jgi:hypothetical protein